MASVFSWMYHASCDVDNSSKLTPLLSLRKQVQTNMAARSDKTPCFIYATHQHSENVLLSDTSMHISIILLS